MNEWYERAKRKLEAERNSGSYDRYASAMKGAVCEALDGFCRQDAEFAQAVVQGGTFADCMKAVAKSCGSAISDLEAFRRAVRFYFPGADVKFHMTINLCADVEAEAAAAAPVASTGPKILDLEDFLYCFTLTAKTSYTKRSEEELAEGGLDFLDVLREEGLGDIIVEKVDPRTLQSTIKDYVEEHGELSEALDSVIRSYDYNDITRRRESAGRKKK